MLESVVSPYGDRPVPILDWGFLLQIGMGERANPQCILNCKPGLIIMITYITKKIDCYMSGEPYHQENRLVMCIVGWPVIPFVYSPFTITRLHGYWYM